MNLTIIKARAVIKLDKQVDSSFYFIYSKL